MRLNRFLDALARWAWIVPEGVVTTFHDWRHDPPRFPLLFEPWDPRSQPAVIASFEAPSLSGSPLLPAVLHGPAYLPAGGSGPDLYQSVPGFSHPEPGAIAAAVRRHFPVRRHLCEVPAVSGDQLYLFDLIPAPGPPVCTLFRLDLRDTESFCYWHWITEIAGPDAIDLWAMAACEPQAALAIMVLQGQPAA